MANSPMIFAPLGDIETLLSKINEKYDRNLQESDFCTFENFIKNFNDLNLQFEAQEQSQEAVDEFVQVMHSLIDHVVDLFISRHYAHHIESGGKFEDYEEQYIEPDDMEKNILIDTITKKAIVFDENYLLKEVPCDQIKL